MSVGITRLMLVNWVPCRACVAVNVHLSTDYCNSFCWSVRRLRPAEEENAWTEEEKRSCNKKKPAGTPTTGSNTQGTSNESQTIIRCRGGDRTRRTPSWT